MSGTAFAQVIPIITTPILTRIYSPEDFGIYSFFSVLAALFGVVSTCRFELAIMLPETDQKAINVAALASKCAVYSFAAGLLIMIPLSVWSPEHFITPSNKEYLWLIPLIALFAGHTQILNYWNSRHKKFKLLAAGKIIGAGFQGIIGIGMGLLRYGAVGMILAAVFSQFSSFVTYFFGSRKKIAENTGYVNRGEMKEMFQKYRSFFYINTPHALLGSFLDTLVIFLLAHYFNLALVGLYAFGYRLLKVPSMFIGGAVYQVFFQRISTVATQPMELQRLTKKLYLQLSLIGAPAFLLLLLFAPPIFSFVFGEEWREAGHIAQILSPWLFLNFLAGAIAPLGIVLNKQKQAIWFTVVDLFLRSTAIIIGGIYQSADLAFTLLSILSGSLLAYALYWFYRLPSRNNTVPYS